MRKVLQRREIIIPASTIFIDLLKWNINLRANFMTAAIVLYVSTIVLFFFYGKASNAPLNEKAGVCRLQQRNGR